MRTLLNLLNGAFLGYVSLKALRKLSAESDTENGSFGKIPQRDDSNNHEKILKNALIFGDSNGKKASKITATEAAALSIEYSKRLLKFKTGPFGKRKVIKSFIISKSVLDDLKTIASNEGREFRGVALTPGYDPDTGYTFMMTALGAVKNTDRYTDSAAKFMHVLPAEDSNSPLIYDHMDLCPTECGGNQDRITYHHWTI